MSIAWVFLYAGYRNVENAAAWAWTKGETTVLLSSLSSAWRDKLVGPCAFLGMVMMFSGGASVLLTLEPRLGGLALAVFCAMGMRIHAVRRDEAKAVADKEPSNAMAWSAYSAHTAAGLKNVALIGAGCVFVLLGSASSLGLSQRPWSFDVDFVGRLLFRQ